MISSQSHTIPVRARLTVHYLLFRNAHLIVDQSMLFDAVAKPDQLPREMLQDLRTHDGTRLADRLGCAKPFLRHVELSLQSNQPGSVELVPESNPIVVEVVIIASKALHYKLVKVIDMPKEAMCHAHPKLLHFQSDSARHP